MNTVYFVCEECKQYIDAGYRWAYATLQEPNIVGQTFSVNDVLNCYDYWDGINKSEWLSNLLPKVKEFLFEHKHHKIRYGEAEDFDHFNDEWIDSEKEMQNIGNNLLPIYLVEILGYDCWDQVIAYINSIPEKPKWFFNNKKILKSLKRRFNLVVAYSKDK